MNYLNSEIGKIHREYLKQVISSEKKSTYEKLYKIGRGKKKEREREEVLGAVGAREREKIRSKIRKRKLHTDLSSTEQSKP